MINNPCSWFINGSETCEYTYEGGRQSYHFSPYDSGLSASMEWNLIFRANSKKHAKIVLKNMMKFGLLCMEKYMANEKAYQITYGYKYSGVNKEPRIKKIKKYLASIDQWVITKAPSNQFFIVGWAQNDTI